MHTHIHLAGIPSRECDIRWDRRPPFSVYFLLAFLWAILTRTYMLYQAAKDARASQDILIDIFERIEMFFRRLEIYTELPSTMEMMDTIIQVMAEVLSILGIATKEIRQGRMSKYLVYEYENLG